MKKNKRLLALLLCIMMSVSLFVGCGKKDETAQEPKQSTEQTENKEVAETREITDMAGRKVTVPAAEKIESVFSSSPVSAIFLYMVAPDKLLPDTLFSIQNSLIFL